MISSFYTPWWMGLWRILGRVIHQFARYYLTQRYQLEACDYIQVKYYYYFSWISHKPPIKCFFLIFFFFFSCYPKGCLKDHLHSHSSVNMYKWSNTPSWKLQSVHTQSIIQLSLIDQCKWSVMYWFIDEFWADENEFTCNWQ